MTRNSKKKSAYQKLAEHKFLQHLMTNLSPLLEDAANVLEHTFKTTGKLRRKESARLPEHLAYDYYVFHRTMALMGAVERLEHVLVLIQDFPNRKAYEKAGISRDRWVEYHYAHGASIFVSIYDAALILTNGVYRLGNDERFCRSDIIMHNIAVDEQTKAALRGIAESIREFRQVRNRAWHHSQPFELHELSDSDTLDWLKLISFVQLNAEQKLIDLRVLDALYDLELKGITAALYGAVDHVSDRIALFFDALHLAYSKRSSRLHLLAEVRNKAKVDPASPAMEANSKQKSSG